MHFTALRKLTNQKMVIIQIQHQRWAVTLDIFCMSLVSGPEQRDKCKYRFTSVNQTDNLTMLNFSKTEIKYTRRPTLSSFLPILFFFLRHCLLPNFALNSVKSHRNYSNSFHKFRNDRAWSYGGIFFYLLRSFSMPSSKKGFCFLRAEYEAKP